MTITKAAMTMILATIPVFIALIYSIRGYHKTKYPNFIYIIWTWFFLWLGNVLLAISYVTMDFNIYRIGIIITAPLLFAVSFLVDMISYNKLDSRKIAIDTALSVALFILAFEPGSIIYNTTAMGEITPAISGSLMIVGALTFLMAGLFWLYYMIKIHLNVPKEMKKISWINVLGALIEGPGSIIAFASGFVWILPGVDYIMISIGALLCAYSFHKEPKLGYVLPFRAHRILFIQKNVGLPLYSYSWDNTGFNDPTLFAGAINGISAILKESLNKWNIREIKFDEGILLIKNIPDADFYCILIASRTNRMLLYGLEKVAADFHQKYGKFLTKNSAVLNLNIYKDVNKLIEVAFPFIISYGNKPAADL